MSEETNAILYNTVSKVGLLEAIKLGMFNGGGDGGTDPGVEGPTRIKILNRPKIGTGDGMVEVIQITYITTVEGDDGEFTVDYSEDSSTYGFIGAPIMRCFAFTDEGAPFNDRIQVSVDFLTATKNRATGVAYRGPDASGTSVAYRAAPDGTPIYAMIWATVQPQ